MEGDSAADPGDGLMFDFDFDNEVDLIANLHNSQAYPNLQNKTLMNFSNENVDQMGSSSGSSFLPAVSISRQNLTASAHTNSQDLDSSLENYPFMGTTPSYNPKTEISSELQLPTEENNQPQVDMVNNSSANLSGHAHFSQESTDLQLLASSPNNFSPNITSSFNTPLTGAAAQPYLPTMEHVELGSSSGSNSFIYNSNSGQQAKNLMGSTYNLGFGGTNPSLGFATNVQQNQSAFLQSALSATSQQYPITSRNQVEMMPQFGRVPSFNPAQQINFNNSNELSTRSENSLQNELILPQRMDSLNLPTTLCADQLAQNVRNNDFLNNQLALPYPTSFRQTSTGLGSVNQQPPTWLSNQNSSYTPLTPSRPQVNQFLAPNTYNSQCANSMPPGSSVPLRSQHSANNQQQQLNPVSAAENVLNPQSQHSIIPEQSMFSRPHNLPSQSNQVWPLAPNVQEPQGFTSSVLPSVSSMPLSLRAPQFPLHQQLINQAAWSPDSSNFHSANSMPPKNSLLPRTQQLFDDHGSHTLNEMMPNMIDPQHYSLFPNPSMPPRTQTFDLQALLNQTTKPSVTYPIPASSQLSPALNSSTQRDIFDGLNPLGLTTSTFPQLELSLNRNEQIFLGRRNRATSPFESGEASSSKRSRMSNFPYKDFILKDNGLNPSQSRENQGDNPLLFNPFNNNQGDTNSLLSNPFNNNIARPGKNALYDPIFEGIGLAIDPHLRLFNSS